MGCSRETERGREKGGSGLLKRERETGERERRREERGEAMDDRK
jgi:hypothetical protein